MAGSLLIDRFADMLPSLAEFDEAVAPDASQLSLQALAGRVSQAHRRSSSPLAPAPESLNVLAR